MPTLPLRAFITRLMGQSCRWMHRVPVVSVEGVALQDPVWHVVDAREAWEQGVSGIPGAEPAQAFEGHWREYRGLTGDVRLLVYCTLGCRSGAYTATLRQRGLDAYNLKGGLFYWAMAERPVVTPQGEATRRLASPGVFRLGVPPGYRGVWRTGV